MAFELPRLSYSYNALEPYIDETTMRIHHGKHHQAYVDNLNKAIEGNASLQNRKIEEVLSAVESLDEGIRQAVINNGGGHANHSFFWKIMCPEGSSDHQSGQPQGELVEVLRSTFGSLEKFKEEFTNKAMSVFGSGWVFLIKTSDGKLSLKRHSFQNSPLMHGNIPILGIDVWEHAYYLKYQNKRAEYIRVFWSVVNWKQANENYMSGIR